jgi:hypothetical protein
MSLGIFGSASGLRGQVEAQRGERGTMSETHALRLRDGKIVEQFVGDNNFAVPYQELVAWKMDFPRDTPDPSPVIAEASARGKPSPT